VAGEMLKHLEAAFEYGGHVVRRMDRRNSSFCQVFSLVEKISTFLIRSR